MFINETIIEEAKKAIDSSETQFKLSSLIFYVSPASEYDYHGGSMPSFFDHEVNGEIVRYVVYKKPSR
jgi:hypothetical protein